MPVSRPRYRKPTLPVSMPAAASPPVRLVEEPYGAEIAEPTKEFASSAEPAKPPDPEGKTNRDSQGFVISDVAVVPSRITAGRSARVHVTFRLNERLKAHWNNEADPLRLWVDALTGWRASERLLSAPRPNQPETQEVRRLDFELCSPPDARGHARLGAYALYYVCEDEGGQCLFLRQDIPIEVEVTK